MKTLSDLSNIGKTIADKLNMTGIKNEYFKELGDTNLTFKPKAEWKD